MLEVLCKRCLWLAWFKSWESAEEKLSRLQVKPKLKELLSRVVDLAKNALRIPKSRISPSVTENSISKLPQAIRFWSSSKSEPGGSRPSHWTSMTWSTPAKAQQPIKIINKYQFLIEFCKKQVFKRTVQLRRDFWVVLVGAHRADELSFRRTQWYLRVIESNSGQKSVRLTGNKENALYISRIQLRTLASPKDETSMLIFVTEY